MEREEPVIRVIRNSRIISFRKPKLLSGPILGVRGFPKDAEGLHYCRIIDMAASTSQIDA